MIREQDARCEVPAQARGVPIPPRYWWLKRISLGVVITLVAVGVVRWRWGVYAQRTLQAEIDSYIAAGQPVYEADFLLPPVPDDQNAGVLLQSIQRELEDFSKKVPKWRATGERSIIKLSEDPEIVQFLVEETEVQAVALRAVRSAELRWQFDGVREATHASNVTDLLILRAALEYRQGNIPECLSLLLDELRWCREVGGQRAFLACLVHDAGIRRASDLLEELLPNLHPNSPECRDLWAEILSELGSLGSQRAYCGAIYRERSWKITNTRMILDQPSSLYGERAGRLWAYLVVPVVPLDAVRMLRHHALLAEAMAARDFPTYMKQVPHSEHPGIGLKGETRPFPAANFSTEDGWKTIARQRMVALALAVRLYDADHGSLPEDLNVLVPEYLPELPKNPFAPEELTFELDATGQWPCIRAAGLKDPRYNVYYIKGRPSAASKTTAD